LRNARIYYDLLLESGCTVTHALLDRHALESTDGLSTIARRPGNPLSAAHPPTTRTGSDPTRRTCSGFSVSTYGRCAR